MAADGNREPSVHGFRWGGLVTVAAWIVYAFAYPALDAQFGPGASGLAIVPVASAAFAFGTRGGVIAGFVGLVTNILLIAVDHPELGPAAILRTEAAAGSVALPVVGLAIGRLRDLEVEHWGELRRRRWAERQIAENQRRFELVAGSVDVVLFALDAQGRFTFAAGKGLERFGTTPEALRGRNAIEFFADEPEMGAQLRRALAGESGEVIVRTAGEEVFELRFSAIFEGGEVAGATGIFADVGHEVRLEKAQQLSEAKSSFLAAMSHELRTPLNAVLGFAQLLSSQGTLDDRQLRYVRHIDAAGTHLLALINDVLDLSKVDAGRMVVDLYPVDLRGLIQEAAGELGPLAEARGLELVSEVPAGPLVVLADRRRMFQVIINLLGNAIKFTPVGQVKIRATAEQGNAVFTVTDTGVGIDLEDVELIFDEFYQARAKLTQPQQGTGLGLALTRRLLGLMGGVISVRSTVGVGSEFRVELPLAPLKAPGAEVAANQLREAGNPPQE